MFLRPIIDYPGDPANKHVCPRCKGPVDRVRRRFFDRLVSLVRPVRRYRCRAKGWDCDWEGTLR